MAYVYYIDDLEECCNMKVINKLAKTKLAILVDDKIFSKELINNIEPAYGSIKDLIPYLYDGYRLDISNNLTINFCDIIKHLSKIWSEGTEERIFNSKNPKYIIDELIKECIIKELDRRLEEIQSDFQAMKDRINADVIEWS